MSVAHIDVIDFISHDPARDVVTLSLVEERPWGERGELLPQLQSKLNTYLTYAGHQLAADYPAVKGSVVEFRLHHAFPLGEREREFVRIVRKHHLDPAGIKWVESPVPSVPPN
jgi:hypothetical protein